MHLLHLTLEPPGAILTALYGSFSAPRQHEFVVARTGGVLELLRPDDQGSLHSVCRTEVFGVVRALQAFRLTGSTVDSIVVGSDSGKTVVLDIDPDAQRFRQVFAEPYGKTGCRRVVPGQYVATDPSGRALLVGAVEKEKLVYIMNRDAAGKLTISSPLEAHKAHTLCFDVVGLDVGFENPVFAALEIDYSGADTDPTGAAALDTQKMVTLYELDLGLNNMVRKSSTPVPRSANKLVQVPGQSGGAGAVAGPGGVLVCSEGWVTYVREGHAQVSTPLPRRTNMTGDRGLLVVAHATHRQRDLFFIMLQSEVGDLYKCSLDVGEDGSVSDVRLQYFDTLPVCSSLCITKKGLLFAASEFGNHSLHVFESLGDEEAKQGAVATASSVKQETDLATVEPPALVPRAPPANLRMVDVSQSYCPIIDMRVADLCAEQTPQVYLLSGRGARSSLRVLRHGLSVSEIAVSELPGTPSNVWAVKKRHDAVADEYLVVSFLNSTLVLGVGETVEELESSPFENAEATIAVAMLENNALIQVCGSKMRMVLPGGNTQEWKPEPGVTIERASCNGRQVLLAHGGGDLTYFELDANGQMQQPQTHSLGVDVRALSVGEVPEGQQRCPFAAVAGYDNMVRLLSLRPPRNTGETMFAQLSMQAATAPVSSLCIAIMPVSGGGGSGGGGVRRVGARGLSLYVGLENGVMQRARVDETAGTLSDARNRFLGARPVQLVRTTMGGERAVLALSSRPWLSHVQQSGQLALVPLSYNTLDHASAFSSEMCDDAIVAVAGNTLRIASVDKLEGLFSQKRMRLRYTPRRLVVHPAAQQLVMIESDHGEFNLAERREIATALGQPGPADTVGETGGEGDGGDEAADPDEAATADELGPSQTRGPVPAEPGKWAACVRVVDPRALQTTHCLELGNNEHAVSIATVKFHDRGGEALVLVGTVKDMTLHPRSCSTGCVHVFRLHESKLQKLHTTEVEDVPASIAEFDGRALVSVGGVLRIYDLGKRKLLRKCENSSFPTHITNVRVAGQRIYVSDLQESFHFVKYDHASNRLSIFADDTLPRFITAQTLLDFDTIAGADKFGNVFVSRLPADAKDAESRATGGSSLWDSGLLGGASCKLEAVCHFHVGDVVTSMVRTQLMAGGREVVLFATISGRLGVLLPLTSRGDIDFYTQLEMCMRQESPPLCGRDHLAYRGYFGPVKECVDGDLCAQFTSLPAAKQKQVADDHGRTVAEIQRKLEDTRASVL